MKSRLVATISIAALALAACGGGDGGAQDEVADMVIEEMEAEGADVDEDCVKDATGDLSDDDAQKILDAGPDGNADDLSEEAQAAAGKLLGCIGLDSVVDDMIGEMESQMGEENVDADCMRDAAADLDLENIDEGNGDLMTAMLECIDVGG
jgi:hypothetical protein